MRESARTCAASPARETLFARDFAETDAAGFAAGVGFNVRAAGAGCTVRAAGFAARAAGAAARAFCWSVSSYSEIRSRSAMCVRGSQELNLRPQPVCSASKARTGRLSSVAQGTLISA